MTSFVRANRADAIVSATSLRTFVTIALAPLVG
jgi:hypothetical protein